jgi:O-acetyl-ADP-ribose deacetylase (regulator of RNase III)
MKIILFDKSTALCNALQDAFRDLTDIQVINCELKDLPEVDYVTAPGNSFAMMTGGLDYYIREVLGLAAQDALQDVILKNYPYGIPVGDYIVLEGCGSTSFNNILYMPTMRTPQKIRPYDAAFVMSIIVDFALAGPDQLTIAIPGIGTGCGTLEPRIASVAMRAGYDTAVMMRRHGHV